MRQPAIAVIPKRRCLQEGQTVGEKVDVICGSRVIEANLLFYPTRYGDGFAGSGFTGKDSCGSSTPMELIYKVVNALPIDGVVIRNATFVFIALNIEQTDFGGIQ